MSWLTGPHGLILLFSVLVGVRDGLSERLLKSSLEVSPALLLFASALSAQLLAIALWAREHHDGDWRQELKTSAGRVRRHWVWVLGASLASFSTLLFFFLAVGPLGGGFVSLAFDSSTPVVTIAIGVLMLKEVMHPSDILSAALGVAGLVAISASRMGSISLSGDAMIPLLYLLCAIIAGGCLAPLLKTMLKRGFARSEVLFLRFAIQSVALGAFLWTRPESVLPAALPWVAMMGVVGFAAPIYLMLKALPKIEVKYLSIYMFASTVVTYAISAGFGYTQVYALDLVGCALILCGVSYPEISRRLSARRVAQKPSAPRQRKRMHSRRPKIQKRKQVS